MTPPPRSSLGCPPRWSTPRDHSRQTYGGKVGQVAEALGTPLMPWQQNVADVALEVDPATGRLAYRTVVLTVPRQQGKTLLLLAVWLQRALGFGGRQRIAWTMQSASDAAKKWKDEHVPVLLASPLSSAVKSVRHANGSEAVFFANGSSQVLLSSKATSGHGQSLDLGVVDEAFAQPDNRLEQAIVPAMRTRPEPQFWIVSTAGTAEATWFHGWVDAGRSMVERGQRSSLAFFEWSAGDDDDPADPATWWRCMPALGVTMAESVIRDEFDKALAQPDGLSGFRRASLNQRTQTRRDPVFSDEVWAAAQLDQVEPDRSRVAFGVEVAEDRSHTSIVVAAGLGDATVVQLLDRRPGTGWVAERLASLMSHRPVGVAFDPSGPAGSLAPTIDAVCAPRCVVTRATGAEQAKACGAFADGLAELRVRVLSDGVFDAALASAMKRPLGDGAWAWGRRSSTADISPLVAATLAVWARSAAPALSDPMMAVW